MYGHHSSKIANYLLDYASKKGNPLTPMQIIKLVYLCHGWMLGLYGRPCINEPAEAWTYGPVVRSLYQLVRKFRSSPVMPPLPSHGNADLLEPIEKKLIKQVHDLYGGYSGIALSNLTHSEGTPWKITWDTYGKSAVISNDLIQEHFSQLYKEKTDAKRQQ